MATTYEVRVSSAGGFQPQTVNVFVGDAVFWHNDDSTPHQPYPVTGSPGVWGPPITGGNSGSQVNMGTAGLIEYRDANDAALRGSVVVSTVVKIGQNFSGNPVFNPATQAVTAGTTVVWQNSDSKPHQPYPSGGSTTAWFPEPIGPGSFSKPVSFSQKGTINYQDALNAALTGTLTVS